MILNEEDMRWLARIREDPDDDGIRLVFADWLEERGRHGNWPGIEFVLSVPETGEQAYRFNPLMFNTPTPTAYEPTPAQRIVSDTTT